MTNMHRPLALALTLLCSLPLFGEETQRYLVATHGRPAATHLHVLANAGNAAQHRVRTFRNIDAFAVDLTSSEAAELRQSEGVELVTPVVARMALDDGPPPNADLELASSWGVEAIHAPAVWPFTRGENVNVALLDTGIDIAHPDLRDAYAGGLNTIDPSKPPQDDNKHGTHVAGIIGARGNGIGVIGVAPATRLWALKVLDAQGYGTDETIVTAIDWVIDHAREGGLWVMNLSLGAWAPSDVEHRAVDRALSEGIVVVAAAGNRTAAILYPARYPGVIAVGALDNAGNRASFSSYGFGLSVMAPGVAVQSTLPQGTIRTADVRPPNAIVPGWGLIGSPLASVHGLLVPAGLGRAEDIPPGVAGNIALVERGLIPFRDKARNAKNAGATAVVIWNNVVEEGTETWTMAPPVDDPDWLGYVFPLVVGVQREDGMRLQDVTARVDVGFRDDSYGKLNGTSMSSPHVAGIAALLRALAPRTPVFQIKYVLEHTAHDLETSGWDQNTGWGAVDALAAAQYVAPEKFGVPPPVPQPSPRRRAAQ
jgi:subtilisin family serine protease